MTLPAACLLLANGLALLCLIDYLGSDTKAGLLPVFVFFPMLLLVAFSLTGIRQIVLYVAPALCLLDGALKLFLRR